MARHARSATWPAWRSKNTSAPSSRSSRSRWPLAEATTRAPRPGELDEQAADPTSGAVDQHPLARPWVQPVQQLDRGGAGQRERGGLDRAEAGWPRAHQRRVQRDQFGVGAPAGAADRQQAPYRVAAPPARAVADGLDASGQFVAHHVWRAHPCPARVGAVAGVDGVHPDRLDRDHDLVRTWLRVGKLLQAHGLGATRLLDDKCAHDAGLWHSPARRQTSPRCRQWVYEGAAATTPTACGHAAARARACGWSAGHARTPAGHGLRPP